MRTWMMAGVSVIGLTLSGGAWAVDADAKIEASGTVDKAWALIGDFCGIKDWHPAIANCEMKEMEGAKIRTLTTKDGGVIVEKLTNWDDAGHSYSYEILESPLPVANYVSTIKVEENGGTVAIDWSSTFDAKGASDDDAKKTIIGIYDAGLGSLKEKLSAP
jgi:polyketide cyclase/dehydrase/lipid transport protein